MKQNGFILIVSLIFLVIMSMLGIAMFGGVSMDEAMSGNEREKSRALDIAQAALNSADQWLNTNPGVVLGNTLNPGVICTNATVQPAICSNAVSNKPADPTTWITPYTPGIVSASSVSAAGGQNTYASQPQYYVQFLGYAPGTTGTAYYQVTATATGGNATAVAVVQAVYQVKCLVCSAE